MTPEFTATIERVEAAHDALVDAGDMRPLFSLMGERFVFWSNLRPEDPRESATSDAWTRAVSDRESMDERGVGYDNVRYFRCPDALVVQCDMVTTSGDGASRRVPVCRIIHVQDALVTRIDEYFPGDPMS